MRTSIRFRRWVGTAVVGGALTAFAEEPAARLRPVDPNRQPAPPVTRAQYPDLPESAVTPVPAQYYGQPQIQPQPAPTRQPAPAQPSRSWVGGAWSGMKEFVVGKPNVAAMPRPNPEWEDPYEQMPQRQPAPVPRPQPRPQPQQQQPQPAPVPQMQPQPQQAPQGLPPPGVYAGPPAYRWYGWGTTTPGMNQFSPNGLYPKGSANWYAHTGATPGAFPVPVQFPAVNPGAEPPMYVGQPLPHDAANLPTHRMQQPQPDPDPRPGYDPRGTLPSYVQQPPVMEPPSVPTPPSGPAMPLPSRPVAVAVTPTLPEVRPPEVQWQTIAPSSHTPAPPRAQPAPQPAPRPDPQLPSDPAWMPAPATYPGTTVPAPAVTVSRGQMPAETPDIGVLIREACFSRVNGVQVKSQGGNKLLVTFTTTAESLAREAAALVSRLPELKPYEVRFEVVLTGK